MCENLNAEEIYELGCKGGNFDYEKGLEALIKKDKSGKWMDIARRAWLEFDYYVNLISSVE